MNNDPMRRLTYLTVKGCQVEGASFWVVQTAAAAMVLEHPEWDLSETKSYAEWEAEV